MKGVATNLRDCRKALGITQEELEARSGVAQANISLYENGRINPNLRNLRRLARALGVPVDALLSGAPPVQPQADEEPRPGQVTGDRYP